MLAIEIAGPGGPDVLRPVTRPVPHPRAGEVLVRVAAAGVNRPDIMQRMGKYPPPAGASDIPGLEISGEIVAVHDVETLTVGQHVCALVAGGGYAAYCAVPAEQCLRIPEAVTEQHAAAIPETFFTVWHNVFERGALKAGETMLIHGGSSGIGTTAIMLAKCHGARVITTVGSEEKAEACRKLGADLAINYNTQDFVAETKKATDGKGAELIVDMVAGDYIQKNYDAARVDGRIVQIAFLRPPKVLVDFRPVLAKRLWHTGSGLRPRPVHEKAAIARAVEENVWPLIAAGKAKPVIYKTFPLREAAAAHALMESSQHIGKIVLTN